MKPSPLHPFTPSLIHSKFSDLPADVVACTRLCVLDVLGLALAVGEMIKAGGEEVITAVAAGNEITCRIGLVAPQQFHKVGFHPTGVIGTLVDLCVR